MSRKQRILSLALENKQLDIVALSPPKPPTDQPISERQPIVTDIDSIFTRPYDFNDHKAVFDFKNEYQNSLSVVHSMNISLLKLPEPKSSKKLQQEEPEEVTRRHRTRLNLKCYERLPPSDDEDQDIFEDSDDSAKD